MHIQVGDKVISAALKSFSRIDGLILNHGTLGDVKRLADAPASEWRSVFDVNFFSVVDIVRLPLPPPSHKAIFHQS
jgi:NADP-dependent 3-hydroxy acid dehydrogenase YdfG